jgi:uncharacterized protein (TIGR02145 family)
MASRIQHRPAARVVLFVVPGVVASFAAGCQGPTEGKTRGEERRAGDVASALKGGELAPDSAYRAVVPIYVVDTTTSKMRLTCTGTLIAPRVVITAAHCIQVDPKQKYLVRFSSLEGVYSYVEVVERKIHPGYLAEIVGDDVALAFGDDVALLRLARSRAINAVQERLLPEHLGFTDDDIGQAIDAVGFGKNGVDPVPDGLRRHLVLPLDDVGSIHVSRLEPVGTGLTRGDSGGPWFIERRGVRYVGGVYSHEERPAKGDAESRKSANQVTAGERWIQDFLRKCDEDADCVQPADACKDAVCLKEGCAATPRNEPKEWAAGVCETGQPGECSAGHRACGGGALTCLADLAPSAETCNGKDDDCDGLLDNGGPEVLNGMDDDCDGLVDEGDATGCFVGADPIGQITDSRDGEKYFVATFGDRCWMVQNLRFDPGAGQGATCVPGLCPGSRVYTWEAASNGMCPSGWRLPTKEDVEDLMSLTFTPYAGQNSAVSPLFLCNPGWCGYQHGGWCDGDGTCSYMYFSTIYTAMWTSTPAGADSHYYFWRSETVGSTIAAAKLNPYSNGTSQTVRCVKE